jgi:hypothetical protein
MGEMVEMNENTLETNLWWVTEKWVTLQLFRSLNQKGSSVVVHRLLMWVHTFYYRGPSKVNQNMLVKTELSPVRY